MATQHENQAQPAIDPAQVREHMTVCRRPAGRGCRIAEVAPDRTKVLVSDSGRRFWVQMPSLVRNWY